MPSLLNSQRIMDEQMVMVQDFRRHDAHENHVSNSCSSSSINEEEEEDEDEEVDSSSSYSPTSPASPSPLQDMSSLLLQLPLKRGLSKHYNGKSQSFTSLSNVKCLEDLAKQENPFNKKLKTCKSYGIFPRKHASCSKKKPSNKGSHFSSHFNGSFLEANNNYNKNNNGDDNNNRPPIPSPYRSTSTSNFIY